MSNKIIGIKQADGSFYPILQDGKADSKNLELTTVRDGQTTVQINLYKKTPDSLDEPVYVDTLLIENLIPHPKKEPTINLNISLDEDNVLTAKVVDPETGKSSDIRVSLVTLSEAQLSEVPDFAVTDAEPFFDENAADSNEVGTDESLSAIGEEDVPVLDEETNTDLGDDFDFNMEENLDDSSSAITEIEQEKDFTSADVETGNVDFADTLSDETAESFADFNTDGLDALDDLTDFETDIVKSSEIEKTETEDFDFAGIGDMNSTQDEKTEESATASENTDVSFDMPDLDDDDFSADTHSADKKPSFSDTAFDIPDFDTESATPVREQSTQTRDTAHFATSVRETPPLYDLNLPDEIDESSGKKKCRLPMLICIVCAVLCILAVIGIFLRFPWKKQKTVENHQANIVTVEPPEQRATPENMSPPVPEENTIVIIEEKTVEQREVIPEKIAPAPEEKPQTVRYLIKWGDTLWDLSDTYYRNPWLYPIIARENKIKNPDLIIAGTYINIPPR